MPYSRPWRLEMEAGFINQIEEPALLYFNFWYPGSWFHLKPASWYLFLESALLTWFLMKITIIDVNFYWREKTGVR